MADVNSIFKEIHEALQADSSLTKSVEAVYEFQLDGDEGTKYQLVLQGENSRTVEGVEEAADCTLLMNSDDFENMAGGELNATHGFMGGRLKLKGNIGLALKLQDIVQSYNKQQI